MRDQHLSDEAVAAFADNVLTGGPRERARRHTAACAECNYAVAVQREAVWALRAAPAPALPIGLLDRLRDVPITTPIDRVPSHVDEGGTAMFMSFAAPAAAFVPAAVSAPSTGKSRVHRARNLALVVASIAVVGSLAGTAMAADSGPTGAGPATEPAVAHPARVISQHLEDPALVDAVSAVRGW